VGWCTLVKIDDVARHAGVAPSTVSYVLSGKRTISEQTRERVMRSVRALGYHPHAGARALASNRSNVVALVIPLRTGIHVPVIMQFATSVVTEARLFDHDVLLLTQDEGVAGLQRVAGTAMVDALVVMDVELYDARIPVLRALQRPAVLIGFPADHEGLTCIDLDFAATGGVCLNHLASLGHRRVALIGSPPEVYKRETGYASRLVSGLKEAAVAQRVKLTVHPCEVTPFAADAVVARLLEDHPDLTAIIIHNEPMVEPLMKALTLYERRVPEDLSVIAICPDEQADQTGRGLTSVAIPAEDIGRKAVRLLMGRLSGAEEPTSLLLPPRLTVRNSTGKAR
jgi:DNA-binding LacI/PurR family transcriptional regulator